MKTGLELIAEERASHPAKGWTADHDDIHDDGALALVAGSLALDGSGVPDRRNDHWQDSLVLKHRGDRVRQLVIAGALIAAEIDRLERVHESLRPKETP